MLLPLVCLMKEACLCPSQTPRLQPPVSSHPSLFLPRWTVEFPLSDDPVAGNSLFLFVSGVNVGSVAHRLKLETRKRPLRPILRLYDRLYHPEELLYDVWATLGVLSA